jgi:hypothetical protein
MLPMLSKRGLLLFAAVMAVAALVIPWTASAASWGPIGTTHNLDSSNLSFNGTSPVLGPAGWFCTQTQFHADVRNAGALAITGANFTNCRGTGAAVGCTLTLAPTQFPWTATGIATNNVTIDGLHVDVAYDNQPATPNSCPDTIRTQPSTWTGTLGASAGQTTWQQAQHELLLIGATGTTLDHFSTDNLSLSIAVSGTVRDTSQTLTLS